MGVPARPPLIITEMKLKIIKVLNTNGPLSDTV